MFRYLTKSSNGALDVEVVPYDQYFADFRDAAQYQQYKPTPWLQQLEDSSSTRAAVAFNNHTLFDPHWSSDTTVNYVTDNYFNQDLGGSH